MDSISSDNFTGGWSCTTHALMSTTAVIGAGGPTGFECVKRLLELGTPTVAVVRNPEKYKDKFPEDSNLQIRTGDVQDQASLQQVLLDTKAKHVIFAASGKTYWSAAGVDEKGVQNAALAARNADVKRLVLVSSALVTPKNRWHPIRIILNNIRWGLMDAKFAGEELLRKSALPYTVVRPGGLTNDPPGQRELVVGQGDTVAGQVARSDVARVCVAALTDGSAKNVTFELSSKKGSSAPADQLEMLFTGLQPDPLP